MRPAGAGYRKRDQVIGSEAELEGLRPTGPDTTKAQYARFACAQCREVKSRGRAQRLVLFQQPGAPCIGSHGVKQTRLERFAQPAADLSVTLRREVS